MNTSNLTPVIDLAIKAGAYIEVDKANYYGFSSTKQLEAFRQAVIADFVSKQWISVEDALPELEDDSVIAYFSNNGSIEMVHIQDSFKDITNGFDDEGNQLYTKWYLSQSITHWMPLPAFKEPL